MKSRYRYVVVEGVIGVGKTTLANQLARRLGSRAVLECFSDNPFLPDFYKDPANYALPTQMFFLMSRFKQKQALAQGDLFERTVVADYMFDKDHIFAEQTLEPKELQLYDRMYQVLKPQVPKPDLVIFLTAELETIMGRIRQRGRGYEQTIDLGYLRTLAKAYRDYFDRCEYPVLSLDTTHVDLRELGCGAVDALVRAIELGRPNLGSWLPEKRVLSLPGI